MDGSPLLIVEDGQLVIDCPIGYVYGLPEQQITINTQSGDNLYLGKVRVYTYQIEFENQQQENGKFKFTCVLSINPSYK